MASALRRAAQAPTTETASPPPRPVPNLVVPPPERRTPSSLRPPPSSHLMVPWTQVPSVHRLLMLASRVKDSCPSGLSPTSCTPCPSSPCSSPCALHRPSPLPLSWPPGPRVCPGLLSGSGPSSPAVTSSGIFFERQHHLKCHFFLEAFPNASSRIVWEPPSFRTLSV